MSVFKSPEILSDQRSHSTLTSIFPIGVFMLYR